MTTKLKNIFISFGLLALFFISHFSRPVHAYDPQDFVTQWQTNINGDGSTTITLNFQKATGAAFYQVSWECDGNYKIIDEAKYTHDYQKTGTFDVCIRSGSSLAFYAPGLTTEEKAKLLKIKQWGYIKWSSFESAFYGMRNMQLTASDAPNLSAVTNMSGAFSGLANFTGNEYMNTWNTINVTDMSNMFLNSPKFNAPIGNWKTDNVENMSGMFRSAKAFNQPIENWNTGNVTNMSATFYVAEAFNQD